MPGTTAMPKRSIRDELLARRRHMAAATCLSRSLEAQQRLAETPEFSAAATVAVYSPICNEVFTEEIFAVARCMGKTVTYPRVCGERLVFIEATSREELDIGAYGILEPTGSRIVPLCEHDLIVVPGVAFDEVGHRLGYGRGFYDRALSAERRRGAVAGLCFDFQVVASLPAESHDVRMDLVVTEERLLRCAGRLYRKAAGNPI